jgi:predicted permease
MRRFSPHSIVKRHFQTLHIDGKKDKMNWFEFSFFSIIPLLVAALISSIYLIDPDTSRILVTVFAVFAGLFLNLLAMIYNIFDRSFQKNQIMSNHGDDRKAKLYMFEETIHNIAFGVLVSIMIVIVALMIVLFGPISVILIVVLNYIVNALLVVFIATVFMVLKRLDNLIASEMIRKLEMFAEAKKLAKKKKK